jgi:hypothetical protein
VYVEPGLAFVGLAIYVGAVKAFWKKLDVDKSTEAVLDAIDNSVTAFETEPVNDNPFLILNELALEAVAAYDAEVALPTNAVVCVVPSAKAILPLKFIEPEIVGENIIIVIPFIPLVLLMNH